MINIASVRFVRRASSVLGIASLAALLSACSHPTPPDASESKSWVIENVVGKSTAELYANVIAPAVFERSGSKVVDGYTVESGNLTMPDKSVGSLVTVRSKDGSLTAIVERSGKNGLLVVNSKGETRFTPFPARDYSLPDTVLEKETKPGTVTSAVTARHYVIDMFIGYTRVAAEAVGGDAYANALAQVESVNLALRNSLVSNVSMRLVGVQIVEQSYPVNRKTFYALPQIFSAGIATYKPDLIYGMVGGHPDDQFGGLAVVRGRHAIGWVYGEAFRHEIGHNAGGAHCAINGGAPVPYGYGHSNGKTSTAQCGNENPYYSTPAVRDAYGLLIGDATNADMARVWRENAARLSTYTIAPISTPENFRKTASTVFTVTFSWDPSPDAVRYEIYYTSPTTQNPVKTGEATDLSYTANTTSNRTIYYAKAVSPNGDVSELSNGASR